MVAPFCLPLAAEALRPLIGGLSAVILLSPIGRALASHFLHLCSDPWGSTYTSTIFRADALAMGVLLAVLWETPRFKGWIREHANWVYFSFVLFAPVSIGIGYMGVKGVAHTGSFVIGFGLLLGS